MAEYLVEIGRDSRKAMRQYPEADTGRLMQHILDLAKNPRPPGCRKLSGKYHGMWRIRVGIYRVLYTVDDKAKLVRIGKVDLRDDAYS